MIAAVVFSLRGPAICVLYAVEYLCLGSLESFFIVIGCSFVIGSFLFLYLAVVHLEIAKLAAYTNATAYFQLACRDQVGVRPYILICTTATFNNTQVVLSVENGRCWTWNCFFPRKILKGLFLSNLILPVVVRGSANYNVYCIIRNKQYKNTTLLPPWISKSPCCVCSGQTRPDRRHLSPGTGRK